MINLLPSPSSPAPLDPSVPMLKPSGANWAIFEIRFKIAISARTLWGHFDGTCVCPLMAHLDELCLWEADEDVAKSLLFQKLPDTTLLHVQKLENDKKNDENYNLAKMWGVLKREYMKKCEFLAIELNLQFMQSKRAENASVHGFFDSLRAKEEELAGIGVPVDSLHYYSIILTSLPESLVTVAAAHIANEIDPHTLMLNIAWEAEYRDKRPDPPSNNEVIGKRKKRSSSNDESVVRV